LKKYGVESIKQIREVAKEKFIVADLKTLDVGKLEVDFAFDATADAVVASGLAATASLDKFILEAQRLGIHAFVDTMEVQNPIEKLRSLKQTPDVVIIHRGIDVEQSAAGDKSPDAQQKQRWALAPKIKELYASQKKASGRDRVLVAVAGGIEPSSAAYALDQGADILIVGRFVASAKDVEFAMRRMLTVLPGYQDIDLKRIHSEDDDDTVEKSGGPKWD
ncbi:MAG: orotidine 5'-phosphate decarboxylase, partial [Candidatus Lokiarchaeota archaeon]|nr:orotidine 5'-phosphate decarboxylase [Candidatus Lokiarchaeota archaeon]